MSLKSKLGVKFSGREQQNLSGYLEPKRNLLNDIGQITESASGPETHAWG